MGVVETSRDKAYLEEADHWGHENEEYIWSYIHCSFSAFCPPWDEQRMLHTPVAKMFYLTMDPE
jgi:hypothetical protein